MSISAVRQEELCANIIEKMKNIDPDLTERETPAPKKSRKSLILGFTGSQKMPKPDKAEAEIRNFFECDLDDDEEPLDWFKKNNERMPTLTKIALKFLFIPATSASSERLFSKAGRIYSSLRCSLSYKTGEVLIFLRANASIASKYSRFNKDFPNEPCLKDYDKLDDSDLDEEEQFECDSEKDAISN